MPSKNQITKRDNPLQSVKSSKHTPKNADLILADLSTSMGTRCGEGETRASLLQKALAPLKDSAHVLAFNSCVFEVDADNLPSPSGSTCIDKALLKAISLEPLHVLVVSDGQPESDEYIVDYRSVCLDAGALLAEQCIIDCMFIGNANNDRAISFMKELAQIGRGRFIALDISNPTNNPLLSSNVNRLLALPSPDGAIKL